MRHLWGHGVGHTYSHCDAPNASSTSGGGQPTLEGMEDDETAVRSAEHSLQPDRDDLQYTLEDFEGEELEVYSDSERDESDQDFQEPDEDIYEEDRW